MGIGINPSDVAPSKEHPPLFARSNVVTADYFKTLGIPLLRGRPFVSAENMLGSKSHVVILDRLAADKLWPGGNPLGKHVRLEEDRPGDAGICEVVGIVNNVRESILGATAEPHVYVPFGQQYQADMQIHLKVAAGGPEAEKRMLETIRHEIHTTDERLPLLALTTMRGHLESGVEIWVVRTGAHILEIFGGVALFLAIIGLYAINAYTVAQRTREIGIRMALGADASSTLGMILRGGLWVTAIGIGIGLLLAIGIGRMLAGILYEVPSIDPVVIASASLVLTTVALFACYLPARKASRVDPMIALRYE
jgi:putative ABC transport system permease protein